MGQTGFDRENGRWRRLGRLLVGALAAAASVVAIATYLGFGPTPKVTIQDVAGPPTGACGDAPQVAGAGWGPDRPTATTSVPAPVATINAIVNNPNYGDERSFLDAKGTADRDGGGFCDPIVVRDGQQLLLRAYVNNAAADNQSNTQTAHGVTFTLTPDDELASLRVVRGTVAADDTDPASVHDTVVVVGPEPFRLDFIAGSARVYSNEHPDGQQLPDRVWGGGSLIGPEKLDGVLPPGYRHALIVTATVRVTVVRPATTDAG